MLVTIWGHPKLAFDAKKVSSLFKSSSTISSIEMLPKIEQDSWTFALQIKPGESVEVFELSDPVRIIIDTRGDIHAKHEVSRVNARPKSAPEAEPELRNESKSELKNEPKNEPKNQIEESNNEIFYYCIATTISMAALVGLSACSSGPQVKQQQYAQLQDHRDFEYDFPTVWKGIEAALEGFPITERNPNKVDHLEMKKIHERSIDTDWIYPVHRKVCRIHD